MKKITFIAIAACIQAYAVLANPPHTNHPSFSWVSQTWNGNNQLYVHVRQQIDIRLAKGEDSDRVLSNFQAVYQRHPSSPLAVFGYAYAAQRRDALHPESMPWEVKLPLLYDALTKVPFPHAFDYARIEFLAAPDDGKLSSVGERILAKNPYDMNVRGKLVNIYMNVITEEGMRKKYINLGAKHRSIELVEESIKVYPKSTNLYGKLGEIYTLCYYQGHQFEDAKRGIAAYQKWLSGAALKDPHRPTIMRTVEWMQRNLQQGKFSES